VKGGRENLSGSKVEGKIYLVVSTKKRPDAKKKQNPTSLFEKWGLLSPVIHIFPSEGFVFPRKCFVYVNPMLTVCNK